MADSYEDINHCKYIVVSAKAFGLYTFPRVKFADTNTLTDQWEHIRSEFVEASKAEGLGDRDEELMDLWHSIETYFRIREAAGVDIGETKRTVVTKNRARGYYTEHRCATCHKVNDLTSNCEVLKQNIGKSQDCWAWSDDPLWEETVKKAVKKVQLRKKRV